MHPCVVQQDGGYGMWYTGDDNLRTTIGYAVFRRMEKVIPTDLTVMIQGETGTGKELVARAIHYNSPRKEKRFIAQNCSALPESLLESELFGYKKGAFTGATNDKPGLFEVADGGTLFLDEITDASPRVQVELLRVLEDGEVRRVGARGGPSAFCLIL